MNYYLPYLVATPIILPTPYLPTYLPTYKGTR